MKKCIFTAFIMLISCVLLIGQENNNGHIKIFQDNRIDTLIEKHIELNKSFESNINNDGITGYRIQIFFDSGNNSKTLATKVMEEFIEAYPNVDVYITFREPYYRVRVGDFRTKMEALAFLRKIDSKYNNAWIIKDKISYPEL